MMRIQMVVTDQPVKDPITQCYVVFVEQDIAYDSIRETVTILFPTVSHVLFPGSTDFPLLSRMMADRDFIARREELLMVPTNTEHGVKYLVLVGLGAKQDGVINVENYRRAVGAAIHEANHWHVLSSLALLLPDANLFACSPEYLAEQTSLIASMAYYQFDEFITDERRKQTSELCLTIAVHGHTIMPMREGCDRGQLIARGVNEARYWVDLPPDHLTPVQLAEKAKEIAQNHGFSITTFNESEVNQMGMGGLGAVARGSDRDCKFVVLEYKTKQKNAPTIGFVGKGITYDSGGLSIKSTHGPGGMERMKEDMAGAAAVLGAMDSLGSLQPPVNIIALLPLAENLPSGKAIKPGDIVRFYNGKTAEIANTDAEGRLILADALAYAVKHYQLDALIDIATLTGAIARALGPFFTGLLSKHDSLAKRVELAATRSGDRVWRLPLDDDYKGAIKCKIADIKNVGSPRYLAGAITAACFLENFVGTVPWVHLDIGGTAFDVPAINYFGSGATGVGVRLLIDLACNWV